MQIKDPTNIITTGMGLIGGAILGNRQRKQQIQDQKNFMELQAKLNKEQAGYSHELAKNMWNFTSYPNQVKKLKQANLSPGIMYGSGGAGGTTAGAGAAGSVGLAEANGTQAEQTAQGMGLQLAGIASQIRLNESQADKNEAEAKKIAGVDTEAVKIGTELQKRITNLQDTIENVMKSQEQLNAATYFKIQAEERRMWEQLRSDIVKADIDEKTKNEQINAVGLANWNSILDGVEKISRTKLNDQQIKKLKNDMAVAWANVAIGEKSVSNQADEITNNLLLGLKDLDRKDKELLKDWIYEGVHAGKEISGEVLNWISRGVGKNVTEVIGRIEEMFDENGNQTGTRTVQQTRNTTR